MLPRLSLRVGWLSQRQKKRLADFLRLNLAKPKAEIFESCRIGLKIGVGVEEVPPRLSLRVGWLSQRQKKRLAFFLRLSLRLNLAKPKPKPKNTFSSFLADKVFFGCIGHC